MSGKSGVTHSADLDAEDALKIHNKKEDIPEGWDFIIRPLGEHLETIEHPTVIIRDDYFKPLEAFVNTVYQLIHFYVIGLPNDLKNCSICFLFNNCRTHVDINLSTCIQMGREYHLVVNRRSYYHCSGFCFDDVAG